MAWYFKRVRQMRGRFFLEPGPWSGSGLRRMPEKFVFLNNKVQVWHSYELERRCRSCFCYFSEIYPKLSKTTNICGRGLILDANYNCMSGFNKFKKSFSQSSLLVISEILVMWKAWAYVFSVTINIAEIFGNLEDQLNKTG